MTDDEMALFNTLTLEAKTEEERAAIRAKFLPHMGRCLLSTNKHVKAVERALEENTRRLGDAIDALRGTVERLHAHPKWAEDKLGWLRHNWMWLVVLAYIAQSLLGIDLAELINGLGVALPLAN